MIWTLVIAGALGGTFTPDDADVNPPQNDIHLTDLRAALAHPPADDATGPEARRRKRPRIIVYAESW